MLVDSPQQSTQGDTSDEMADVRIVQNARKLIIRKLLTDKNALPEDKSDKIMLLQAMDGLDNSAIKRMRIKSDEKTTNANVANAAMIASLLTRVTPGAIAAGRITNREAPVLTLEHSSVTLVPGELEIGTKNMTLEEFQKEFEENNPGSLSGAN